MAYNNNPYTQQRPPTNLPPLRPPQGYDQVAHPPPSPRLNSGYDNSDIQDDPYAQNPNLPPQGRFYGVGMHNDFQRQSLAGSEVSLHHPGGSQLSLASPYADTPRTGIAQSPSTAFIKGYGSGGYYDEPDSHEMAYRGDSRGYGSATPEKGGQFGAAKPPPNRRRRWIIISVVVVLILAAAACAYLFVIKPKLDKEDDDTGGKSNNGTASAKPYAFALSGGDKTEVPTSENTSFIYSNPFGGKWVYDPNNPFDDSAQAQTWTKPLNQPWDWKDRIRGVNVGGWLVLEPFISPAMFEIYGTGADQTKDEYTLSLKMAADTKGKGFDHLREHYKTFITEQDFADMAGAGLNWIRLPMGFWAIETHPGEPYLAKESWAYVLKALSWARKYGIRVNLDLHGVPGSQNGWNHSGRLDSVNFMVGVMGIANAQRTMTYQRMLVQFVSQPQYRNVVLMFGILNEAAVGQIGFPQMQSYYAETYSMIRSVTGIGENKGPLISIHDGFLPFTNWTGFLEGADRVGYDTHFYYAFGKTPNNRTYDFFAQNVCDRQQPKITDAYKSLGHINTGEFSLATNDCGRYVNGVGLGYRFEGTYEGNTAPGVGNCDDFEVWEKWSPEFKASVLNFTLHELDALYSYFWWTYRIGPTTLENPPAVRSPLWSFELGYKQGWIPKDPRDADGACTVAPYDGALLPWQTGGVGAGTLAPDLTQRFPWPPVQISSTTYQESQTPDVPNMLLPTALPWYTPTGSVIVLPTPTFFGATKSVDGGNGIANAKATQSAFVAVAGCTYPDPYNGNAPIPPCGQPAAKRDLEPLITPAPR